MSSLASSIRAVGTGTRSYAPRPYTTIETNFETVYNPAMLKYYSISVTLGAQVACADDSDLAYAVRKVKESIIYEIFGEFRKPMDAVRRALYERDIGKAHKALDELGAQMFDAG